MLISGTVTRVEDREYDGKRRCRVRITESVVAVNDSESVLTVEPKVVGDLGLVIGAHVVAECVANEWTFQGRSGTTLVCKSLRLAEEGEVFDIRHLRRSAVG